MPWLLNSHCVHIRSIAFSLSVLCFLPFFSVGSDLKFHMIDLICKGLKKRLVCHFCSFHFFSSDSLYNEV
ncbi:unnamed protein product [Brassica oleracea]